MSRKLIARLIIAIALVLLVIRFFNSQPEKLVHLTGQTMGTIQYNVKYVDGDDYQLQVDSILERFNQSLSTYISDSEISIINNDYRLSHPSQMMLDVLRKSEEVWIATYGAFDPTVGPIVNAWGFGPDKQPNLLDSATVDSLLVNVGFGKLIFNEEEVQMDPHMFLDFSAIAKGYAVDLVASFLERKGMSSYMVEIGGEVKVKGRNAEGELWRIGIEDPLVEMGEQRILAVTSIEDRAMATSGDYRNYYELDGKVIAHTIDPRTGYTAGKEILSATVFANDCMTADAYATAFMVLGVKPAIEVLKQTKMDALLVYRDQDNIEIYISPALEDNVEVIEDSEKAL